MASLKVVMWNSGAFGPPLIPRTRKWPFLTKNTHKRTFQLQPFWKHHKDEDDFPDLINEYMGTHHCRHIPTPPDHTHSGIIVLVDKQYDILQSVIKIPGRLLNLHLRHKATTHTYNLTVYYVRQVK